MGQFVEMLEENRHAELRAMMIAMNPVDVADELEGVEDEPGDRRHQAVVHELGALAGAEVAGVHHELGVRVEHRRAALAGGLVAGGDHEQLARGGLGPAADRSIDHVHTAVGDPLGERHHVVGADGGMHGKNRAWADVAHQLARAEQHRIGGVGVGRRRRSVGKEAEAPQDCIDGHRLRSNGLADRAVS